MASAYFYTYQLQYQEVTEPLNPPPTLDPLTWQPRYPDLIDPLPGLPAAILAGAFFFGAPPPAAPAPLLAEQPVYPERVRGPEPLTVSDLTTVAYAPAIDRWGVDGGQIPWKPTYPDQLLPAPDTNSWTGHYAHVEQVVLPAPDLSWQPTFPGQLLPALDANSWTGAYSHVEKVVLPASPLSWHPSFPDFPGAVAPDGNSWTGAFAYTEQVTLPAPTLAWQPSFPAQLLPALDANAWFGVRAVPVAPIVPYIQGLPWLPTYPDMLLPAPDVGSWSGSQVFQLQNVPPPELSWLPIFPDFARAIPPPPITEYYKSQVEAPVLPTFTSYASPFLFTAVTWSLGVKFALEVYIRATTGTVYARLADLAGNPVSGSQVSTSSSSFVRLRSSSFQLVDGTSYRVQLGKVGSDGGEAVAAKLVGNLTA